MSSQETQVLSQQVKNRRYRALQKMIDAGEYFSENAMKKRCPDLYDYYIGRYLTNEEKEAKLREQASLHPSNLSEFFMDVIEKKLECEESEEEVEYDEEEEEEEEEEDAETNIPNIEKENLAEEFKSRMYQRFLDGSDKHFEYDSVDSNPEYDDMTLMERDAEDHYFDEEEPGINAVKENPETLEGSEDELDVYMRKLKEDDPDEPRETEESGNKDQE